LEEAAKQKWAVGRSCAHAEHGKVRANEKGREMKEGERARENGGRIEGFL
jgi:hypothetical protein